MYSNVVFSVLLGVLLNAHEQYIEYLSLDTTLLSDPG